MTRYNFSSNKWQTQESEEGFLPQDTWRSQVEAELYASALLLAFLGSGAASAPEERRPANDFLQLLFFCRRVTWGRGSNAITRAGGAPNSSSSCFCSSSDMENRSAAP